ncbi:MULTISPECIES: HdeD family acid-resistance protein [Rhodobacterales]|uniref:HdeD family acid-resistance protein n=1 Tax=Rhodobacterales TaxID=204455 RepID=UPI000BBED3A5|nr:MULTISPECIES: DUF308 domain-containing protein [Paracoccaceae]MCE6951357.1 DUF308 domain-containing protein [Cereibacter sphaeroides]MCE6970051.1 DUF308 domain-containing protein [Cereibacter sphaeroides]
MSFWVLCLIAGLVSLTGGILALVNPFAASLTAEHLTGLLFLVAGALQLFSAFRGGPGAARFWTGVVGAFGLVIGISLLARPLEGLIALTLLAAIFFLVSGLAKVALSFVLRTTPIFWPMLLSGALSVLLGAMVLSDFPASAAILLGVLLAIELISSGAMLTALALQIRRRA